MIGSEKIWDHGADLPSRLQSFEAQMLAEDGNFSGLARLNRELVGKNQFAVSARFQPPQIADTTQNYL